MRKRNMSRQPALPAAEGLEAELARISRLGLDELRALWRTMARRNPPPALSRDMLARMVAYKLQEQWLGKLNAGTRKLLDRLARGGSEPVRHLKVGTVMVREHRGTLHEVMVVPGGFHWQGKIHASLSTIARRITGTAWNGPRFFGLRGKAEPGVPDKSAIEPVGQDARLFVRGALRAPGHAAEPRP
jgi:hypothetical protein